MNWIAILKATTLLLSVCAFVLYLSRTRKFPRWDRVSLLVARAFLMATGALSLLWLALDPADMMLHLATSIVLLSILSWYLLRHALLEVLLAPLAFAYLFLSMISVSDTAAVSWLQAALYFLLATSFHISLMGLLLANLVRWVDSRDIRREPNWSPRTLAAHTRQSLC